MGKSYTGNHIVTKVRQASSLIEQGRPLQEVWASVQISRQTYNRWKEICDSIQSELEFQIEDNRKQIDLLDEENHQLKTELDKALCQHQECQGQSKAADQRPGTLSSVQNRLIEADNARKSSDKAVEELKGQLAKVEKQLQETVAANEELARRHKQSEEQSRKMTEQLEQLKAEPTSPSDSEEDSTPQDKGSAQTRPTSHDKGRSLEAPDPQDMDLSSEKRHDEYRENPLDVKHRLEGERYNEMLKRVFSGGDRTADAPTQGARAGKLCRNVRGLRSNQICPIGIDIEDECITLVQLGMTKAGINVIQARKVVSPYGIDPDSDDWGRWAVSAVKDAIRSGGFRNRKVCLALPVRDTFIDNLTIPNSALDRATAIYERIHRKLPYRATRENTIIKWIPTEGPQVIAIALERQRVERCLALCDRAKLKPETFSVWPVAIANSYSRLLAQADRSFVMLFDVAMNYTNLAICRDKTLYYARTIHIGARDLETGPMIRLLTDQIELCHRHFTKTYGNRLIGRSIFFVGQAVDRDIIVKIARQVGISAQLGDPFKLMKVSEQNTEGVEAEKSRSSWLVAIGLGLEGRMRELDLSVK